MKALYPQIIAKPPSPQLASFVEEEKVPIVLAPDVIPPPSPPVEEAGNPDKDFLTKFKGFQNDLAIREQSLEKKVQLLQRQQAKKPVTIELVDEI